MGRGRIIASQVLGAVCRISGEAPLAETNGYATALRDMTHGHGAFTLENVPGMNDTVGLVMFQVSAE